MRAYFLSQGTSLEKWDNWQDKRPNELCICDSLLYTWNSGIVISSRRADSIWWANQAPSNHISPSHTTGNPPQHSPRCGRVSPKWVSFDRLACWVGVHPTSAWRPVGRPWNASAGNGWQCNNGGPLQNGLQKHQTKSCWLIIFRVLWLTKTWWQKNTRK